VKEGVGGKVIMLKPYWILFEMNGMSMRYEDDWYRSFGTALLIPLF
jgi:hypothetical protein